MRKLLAIFATTLALAVTTAAGEVIDKVLAVVNGTPILQSDWEDALRVESFSEHKAVTQVSYEDERATLDRVIDQELLKQQMRGFRVPPVGDDAIQQRVREMREQTPGASNEAGWNAALAREGLTQEQLVNRLRSEMTLERFIELRLRPAVHIDAAAVEAYYHDEFLPEVRRAGGKEPQLPEVSRRIREILVQQEMNNLLEDWLKTLRAQSDIRMMNSPNERAALPDEKNP